MGQLAGVEDDDGSEESDDAFLVADALGRLADAARPGVVGALLAHFGNESGLFLSLSGAIGSGRMTCPALISTRMMTTGKMMKRIGKRPKPTMRF